MTKRKTNSVGYFSAYYRGLETLLDLWPRIRQEVPDATLDVYYGWESWVAIQGEDDFYHRMEQRFDDLKAHGVTVHGRVSHQELADAMRKTQVWAYPTEFEEIHCITALKAQEAGCYPVVTNVGALKETVQCGDKIDFDDISTNLHAQDEFATAVIDALKKKKTGTPVPKTDWSDIAKQWSDVIEEKLHERTSSSPAA